MSAAEVPRGGPGRPTRAAPLFGLPDAWWPVARGAEVTSQPRSFRLGTRALAVYRDATNAVRAVDDRCPHRRMPLSMGWVTEEGYLQCAYHGWCFDGATGQCAAIPNLAPDERVSPSIRVSAFRTAEAENLPTDAALTQFDTLLADGFVHVWTGEPDAAAATHAQAQPAATATGDPIRGELEVRSPYQRVAEALVWNPGRALGLGLLLGSGDETIDPEIDSENGSVTVTRERLTVGLRRASTFDPIVDSATRARITTLVSTGLTRVEAASERRRLLASVVIGLTPIGEYRTMVRWHGAVRGPGGPVVPIGSRALTAARRLSGRDVASVEHVADLAEEAVDPAVDRIRTLRGG